MESCSHEWITYAWPFVCVGDVNVVFHFAPRGVASRVYEHVALPQEMLDLQNCSMCPLAFVAGSLQGHWWGVISRNYVVWPIFFLKNVFVALKGTHFLFWFAFTAAGVVQCGGRKTSPRTSTIVQFIFYSWSFEISVNILIGLNSYSRQVFNPILIYISL